MRIEQASQFWSSSNNCDPPSPVRARDENSSEGIVYFDEEKGVSRPIKLRLPFTVFPNSLSFMRKRISRAAVKLPPSVPSGLSVAVQRGQTILRQQQVKSEMRQISYRGQGPHTRAGADSRYPYFGTLGPRDCKYFEVIHYA